MRHKNIIHKLGLILFLLGTFFSITLYFSMPIQNIQTERAAIMSAHGVLKQYSLYFSSANPSSKYNIKKLKKMHYDLSKKYFSILHNLYSFKNKNNKTIWAYEGENGKKDFGSKDDIILNKTKMEYEKYYNYSPKNNIIKLILCIIILIFVFSGSTLIITNILSNIVYKKDSENHK